MSPVAPAKTARFPSILSQISEAKSQITRTQRLWLITFGAVFLTLIIGVALIHIPWQERRQSLAARYSEEKERSELLLSIQRQQAELQNMESKFLLEGGATGLAGQISQLAAESKLQIESVTPQPEVLVEPYTRLQIEITATSNLSNVLHFLRAVEEHRPVLWVEQLDLGALSSEGSAPLNEKGEGTASVPGQERQKVQFLIGAVSRLKTPG